MYASNSNIFSGISSRHFPLIHWKLIMQLKYFLTCYCCLNVVINVVGFVFTRWLARFQLRRKTSPVQSARSDQLAQDDEFLRGNRRLFDPYTIIVYVGPVLCPIPAVTSFRVEQHTAPFTDHLVGVRLGNACRRQWNPSSYLNGRLLVVIFDGLSFVGSSALQQLATFCSYPDFNSSRFERQPVTTTLVSPALAIASGHSIPVRSTPRVRTARRTLVRLPISTSAMRYVVHGGGGVAVRRNRRLDVEHRFGLCQ